MHHFQVLFSLLLALLGIGCASSYTAIGPLGLKFDQPPAVTFAEGDIQTSYRYNLLKDAGNRKYARNETRQGVSLLAVKIANHGPDTLLLPEHLLVLAGADTLYLLAMDEAGQALSQSAADERASEVVDVEVDAPFIMLVGGLVHAATRVEADLNFAREMQEFYLLPSSVAPGISVVGLLAVEVERGTPLAFIWEK